MKDLINSVNMKMVVKSLVANGVVKNLQLKAGGNVINIGEITLAEVTKGNKPNVSFNKEAGGKFEVAGDLNYKIIVKGLSILCDGGEEFSTESLELNSVAAAMELFASIAK